MPVPFFHHPGTLDYDFGPRHPLKPERLRRALRLLAATAPDVLPQTPEPATDADLGRVHSDDYLAAVAQVDRAMAVGREGETGIRSLRERHGLYGDNPPFAGMDRAARAYSGSTVAAAQAVQAGAPLAIALDGGLHHAHRERASGFCLYDDPAVACAILRDRFERVAYVDIDVHHGDGVQWIFYDDASVLTCSIHEDGRTLFPGTGGAEERGVDDSAVNVPLPAGTRGDAWLAAFERGILPALDRFEPGAIVLQMGTDAHFLDPLAHLEVRAQDWLAAVAHVRDLGLPTVAVGGGGYNLTTVPRMWVGAVLTLLNRPVPDMIPPALAPELGASTLLDSIEP